MAVHFPSITDQQINRLRSLIEHQFADQSPTRPQIIEFEGQRFVVKFQRQEKNRSRQERLSALGYFLLFRKWLHSSYFRSLDVQEEAQRLISLQRAGVHVAPVYFHDENYFIQAYSGISLDTVLPRRGENERIDLIFDVMADLAQLHAHGQWHGGPQIRNLTLLETPFEEEGQSIKQLFRIDFEERFGFYTPLALAQCYDLFLTFNSIKKFLNDDLDLGEKLFMHYWKAYPNAELIPYLQKVLRWLSPLMAIGRLLGRINKHNNDINTSIFFGQILKTSLPNLKPHQTPS
ncbi:MAG TPA: hypothetical protein VK051_02565 [Paenalcaligenes sp.]|nr:hypothetical protein [Paenalcaligenes sp.]